MKSRSKPNSAGTNFVAHLNAEMGVGEVARRLASLLSAAGMNLNLVQFEASTARKQQGMAQKVGRFDSSLPTISCVNADQLGALVSFFGISPNGQVAHRGFWAWELEDFPDKYLPASKLLDEIWTLSNFAETSISQAVATKVKTIKVPVPIPKSETTLSREDFGIAKNVFLVTSSFDFNSEVERKNPAGAISAFMSAFPKPSMATLLLKSINGDKHPSALESLREQARNRKDIVFLDGYMNHYENHGLLEVSDVYLSLHRSEGYGLNLADSMARKTAVIATGYSGNLDFMDEKSSVLIPYEKVSVSNYAGIRVHSKWANPDLDYASHKLRYLFNSPLETSKLANSGFLKIRDENSLKVVVEKFQKEFMDA